jgi:hypothetical protein
MSDTRWMLGGEPPEPHVKRVRDPKTGKIAAPRVKGTTTAKAEARAREVAEATGTVPEADDEPTPILPAEVARLHGED